MPSGVYLGNMDYTQFKEHLEKRGIKSTEEEWVDSDAGEVVLTVKPEKKGMRERSFSTDGGWQIKY